MILVAIAVTSIYLLNAARTESAWVVHTIEAENQISRTLLNIRRVESATRGYVLTQNPQLFDDYQHGAVDVIPAIDALAELIADNPVQVDNVANLRSAAETRLKELQTTTDQVRQNDLQAAMGAIRSGSPLATMNRVSEIAGRMQREEDRLFTMRSAAAERGRLLSAVVTIAGTGLVLLLGGLSIFLVRRSSRQRDLAEKRLQDSNLNLEEIVDERMAELREANEEIQRFAYIVSHDLRSPLVNIMGFTSELEELRFSIFNRISHLDQAASGVTQPITTMEHNEPLLNGDDKKLADEYSESLGFIQSSIGKMDRLIGAILNLTREGRRQFHPESIDVRELIVGIYQTMAHQTLEANAQIEVQQLPSIVCDRLAMEQIFSNLIDNALKYLKRGIPGRIVIRGRSKLGFAIFEVSDNGRGIDPKDHQRIFDLFRRAGTQDRPGQGIGLAHVRALVRRLGGSMSVDSEPNEGSTFTVTLPIKHNLKEGQRW